LLLFQAARKKTNADSLDAFLDSGQVQVLFLGRCRLEEELFQNSNSFLLVPGVAFLLDHFLTVGRSEEEKQKAVSSHHDQEESILIETRHKVE
jgi:hypothetical protein